MIPVCRNIYSNDLYQYLGGNTFRNIRTGAEGELDQPTAAANLKINIEATTLLNKYPVCLELIQKLNLKMQPDEKGKK